MPNPSADFSKAKVLDSAQDTIADLGLTGWTVQAVATRLGCAKGLILYHFGTKETLLRELGLRLLMRRLERRIEAIGKGGSDGLDALWQVIEEDVRNGTSRVWLALVAEGPLRDSVMDPRAWTAVSSTAVRALQLPVDTDPGECVLDAVNGFELALLLGRAPELVRESYDRYWLRMFDPAE
jgi:AcrR family transcriptional regulator